MHAYLRAVRKIICELYASPNYVIFFLLEYIFSYNAYSPRITTCQCHDWLFFFGLSKPLNSIFGCVIPVLPLVPVIPM